MPKYEATECFEAMGQGLGENNNALNLKERNLKIYPALKIYSALISQRLDCKVTENWSLSAATRTIESLEMISSSR